MKEFPEVMKVSWILENFKLIQCVSFMAHTSKDFHWLNRQGRGHQDLGPLAAKICMCKIMCQNWVMWGLYWRQAPIPTDRLPVWGGGSGYPWFKIWTCQKRPGSLFQTSSGNYVTSKIWKTHSLLVKSDSTFVPPDNIRQQARFQFGSHHNLSKMS